MGGVVSEGRAPGIASDGAGVFGFVRGGGPAEFQRGAAAGD